MNKNWVVRLFEVCAAPVSFVRGLIITTMTWLTGVVFCIHPTMSIAIRSRGLLANTSISCCAFIFFSTWRAQSPKWLSVKYT